jgi:tRNA G10  N-methylase Trm11
MEAFSLLKDLDCLVVKNSPMGDVKGVFCVAVKKEYSKQAKLRFHKLGYTNCVMLLDFNKATGKNDSDLNSINDLAIKGKVFDVKKLYTEDDKAFAEEAPDRRKFLLKSDNGETKEVKGYRGDGTETGKRALPVEDCRLLVNLESLNHNQSLLDPFAGGGGIIYQARKTTEKLFSNDIDFKLEEGLRDYGAIHTVLNVNDLIFKDNTIDAIVTEVPFSETCNEDIIRFFNKSYDYLTENGKLIVMYAREQSKFINKHLSSRFLKYIEFELDRKGTDVTICAYVKSNEEFVYLNEVFNQIKTIF